MSEKIRKQERQPYFKGEINPAYFVINISKKLKYNYKNNIIKNYINKKVMNEQDKYNEIKI